MQAIALMYLQLYYPMYFYAASPGMIQVQVFSLEFWNYLYRDRDILLIYVSSGW
jgi:hypothetical protein